MRAFTKCAVSACFRPGTRPVEYRGNVVCAVCVVHERGSYEGWTLALRLDVPPVLYAPGALQ